MGQTSENACLGLSEITPERLKYLVAGGVLANLMPLCVVVPEFGLLIISIYSMPMLLVEHFGGLHNYLVVDSGGILVPQKFGFLIGVPFWTVVGVCIGDLTWRRQGKKGRVNIPLPQMVSRIGGTLLATIFISYIAFMVIAVLVYN